MKGWALGAVAAGLALFAGCGGSGAEKARVIDHPGAPYALAIPPGMTLDAAPLDGVVLGQGGSFVSVLRVGGGDRTLVVVGAFAAGEAIADPPEMLGRRYWSSLGLAPGNAASHGPVSRARIGGRTGFSLRPTNLPGLPKGAITEVRGTTIGRWLVIESCVAVSGGKVPTSACDAVSRSIQLRDAPSPPTAAGGAAVAPPGAPFRIFVPRGFTAASPLMTDRARASAGADYVASLAMSWQNEVDVLAMRDAGSVAGPIDGRVFCGALKAQYGPPDVIRPVDTLIGGRQGAGCVVTAPVETPEVFADQAVRFHVVALDGWTVVVACTSTRAQKAALDRGCDAVLRAIQFVKP